MAEEKTEGLLISASTKWEYLTTVIVCQTNLDLQTLLNYEGHADWELVQIERNWIAGNDVAIYKRPVQTSCSWRRSRR